MQATPTNFAVESESDGRRALEAVRARFPSRPETAARAPETFYDTFDWRLFRRGHTLSSTGEGSRRRLQLTGLDGTLRHRLPNGREPA